MKMKDFYSILGVSQDASKEDIKKAYKNLAKKYHPDVNSGNKAAVDKFKEVTEAYEVLSDDEKRSKYDRLKSSGFSGYGNGNFDFSGTGGGYAGGADFEDILSSIFGGGGKGKQNGGGFGDIFESFFDRGGSAGARGSSERPSRGEDIEVKLDLTLKQAAGGGSLKLKVNRRDLCPFCSGEGGSGNTACHSCRGTGSISRSQGGYAISQPCPQCSGRGKIKTNICSSCAGNGFVNNIKQIKVDIPEGVADGQLIRIPGEGHAGVLNAPRGNIIITVRVKSDEQFSRQGDDLYYELPLKFTEAALGAVKMVPTIRGSAKVNIPAGAKSGSKLKLKGQGIKNNKTGAAGDQIITIKIDVPSDLSDEVKKILIELDKLI
jgi:molecular chaperone DnaJ